MKTEKLSVELRLIIQMIQQELWHVDVTFETKGIDWNRFSKSGAYHGMRLLVFVANQKQSVLPDQMAMQLKHYSQRRAKKNLVDVLEIKRLYDLFTKEGIHPSLLKGVLFTSLLYQNQILRESSDIDFLFEKEEALRAIELLLADGFVCQDLGVLRNATNLKKDINQLVFETDFQELHFEKKLFMVDFHWELCNQFLNYKVDLGLFFKNLETINFYGKEIKVSNPNALFWSLVLHHGGKELWLKFKNLVDLIAFMERYQKEIDWDLVIRQAKEFKILVSMKTGFYLIHHIFDYPLPAILRQEIQDFVPSKLDQIIAFWNESKYWNKTIPRWRYEQILHHSQDDGYSIFGYIYKLYQTYSVPNPFEHKRIFNFPASWTLLNFIDKIISYLLRKRM
jgi:hypothetical protein